MVVNAGSTGSGHRSGVPIFCESNSHKRITRATVVVVGTPLPTAPLDGRTARRLRGRTAVIDAAFQILQEGRVPPPVHEVAARAGVSVSTIFRYFDGLDDLHIEAFARFRQRFAPLLVVPDAADRPRTARIAAFVDARLRLYEECGAIIALARLRALEYSRAERGLAELRRTLREQVLARFRAEIESLAPAKGADLAAVIDGLTSPEAWDVGRRGHDRSSRQIRRAWIDALDALLPDSEAT